MNTDSKERFVLCLVPGYQAMREFLLKGKPYIKRSTYQSANAAIESFNTIIKRHYQSHAKLKKLIENNQPSHLNASNVDKRKAFYHASKHLLGASVERLFSGHILQENSENAEFLHEIVMISKKGIERNKSAAPCVLYYTHPHPEDFNKPDLITKQSTVKGNTFSIGIVDEHSTENLIDSYVNFSPTNLGLAFDDLKDGVPFDATFLFSNPDEIQNPLFENTQCSSTFISVKSPTQKLTMAIFLERKIDLQSSVNIGCYHSPEKVEDKKLRDSDAWTEHLPGDPELKLVNLDSPIRNSNISNEVIELSDYMFSYANLDRKNFVCYLMDVEYPIWSSTYRVYFDHR